MQNQNNYYTGAAFNTVNRPVPSNSQPLTQQIVDELRADNNNFDMKVDQKDLWRAICTHKDPTTGASTLTPDGDGYYKCSICGARFHFFDGTPADVQNAVNTIVDMLQTAKTIYLDAPRNMTEKYYQYIILLMKFPALWQRAVECMKGYSTATPATVSTGGMYGSGFNALNNLLYTPYASNIPYGSNPQYPMMNNQQFANPQFAQQYPMNNGYGMYQAPQQPMMDPNYNPMAYGAPVAPAPGVMPQAPQPMANNTPAAPQAPQQPAAATPPAANNEIQQQKVFNV